MKLTWAQVLEAMYGHQVSDNQITVWEHYLKAENTNSAELVKVIEMAANESMKPEEWRVTVRDLCKWLRIYRKREAARNAVETQKARIDGFVVEWREKLNRGAKRDDLFSSLETLKLPISEQNEVCRRILG